MSNDRDNIIDFKSGKAARFGQIPPDPEQIAADSIRRTRDRLAYADAVSEQLRKSLRIGKEDRPRLARNLGRMFESAGIQRLSDLIGEVFRMAFPQGDAAESALKKRKRYVRLKDELLPPSYGPGEYNAHGAAYVSLAEAFAKIVRDSSQSPEDNRRRAILNLIEGTAWDDRRSAATRRAQAGQQEFADRMDDVLSQVVAAVDLDVLFDAAAELPLTATYGREPDDWSDLRLEKDIRPLDVEHDQEIVDTHFLAPRVMLGMLYTRKTVSSHIPIALPQGVDKYTAPENLLEIVNYVLAVQYGTDLLDATVSDVEDLDAVWEKYAVEESEGIALGWEGLPIILSIQRERSACRPCLAITSPTWNGSSYERDFKRYLVRSSGSLGHDLGQVEVGTQAEFFFHRERYGSLVHKRDFFSGSDHTWCDRVLLVPSALASELLFTPLLSGDSVMHAPTDAVYWSHFQDCPDGFSPAPHRSIAGAILRNLAHGPEGSRIDELLIENAKRKVAEVAALQKQLGQSYLEKIARLHSDPPRGS